MRQALFLDRDGVLNRAYKDNGIWWPPRLVKAFELLPGITDAIKAIREAGLLVICVTNQPDVARGDLSLDALGEMHDLLERQLPLDGVYCCCHDDGDHCGCRKPEPGLLYAAAYHHEISLCDSWMIGDSPRDAEAGRRAGCKSFVVGTNSKPCWAEIILKEKIHGPE